VSSNFIVKTSKKIFCFFKKFCYNTPKFEQGFEGEKKKENSIMKFPFFILNPRLKSAGLNRVLPSPVALRRLTEARRGFRAAQNGTKAVHSGAQLAQNGAPMAHAGSRRLTKTSPKPSGWLKKCGLCLK